MSTPTPAAVCTNLTFAWPDGHQVLNGLSATFPAGRTGLIGVNGSGKSTLLRLIAGHLQPAAGSITVHGRLGHVPQNISWQPGRTVAHALGVEPALRALRAIESGDVREEHFETVGTDWDIEERSGAVLDGLGLATVQLDRGLEELSGGEATLVCLAAHLLQPPDVLLLDEPTNNLDSGARERLYDAIRGWRGSLIVVSHDRDLLELVDQVADLRQGDIYLYGGGWSAYETAVAAEQEAAEQTVRTAKQDLRRQRRELIEARTKLDRRKRYGDKMEANKREPKIVMGERKRQAQVSSGKHRQLHQERLAAAEERLSRSEDALIDHKEIRIDLPATHVPSGRRVLTLRQVRTRCQDGIDLEVVGPERIALVGANGSGKSTLLQTITGELPARAGQIEVTVPVRYLPQRLAVLDPGLSVAQNVARSAPQATDNQIRAQLARFLFRGAGADQLVEQLSGGERFRAALAAVLLAQPPPQLLLLDEPTNNLDLASMRELTQALAAYRGALIIASHDHRFLREVGVTRWLETGAFVREVDPR